MKKIHCNCSEVSQKSLAENTWITYTNPQFVYDVVEIKNLCEGLILINIVSLCRLKPLCSIKIKT